MEEQNSAATLRRPQLRAGTPRRAATPPRPTGLSHGRVEVSGHDNASRSHRSKLPPLVAVGAQEGHVRALSARFTGEPPDKHKELPPPARRAGQSTRGITPPRPRGRPPALSKVVAIGRLAGRGGAAAVGAVGGVATAVGNKVGDVVDIETVVGQLPTRETIRITGKHGRVPDHADEMEGLVRPLQDVLLSLDAGSGVCRRNRLLLCVCTALSVMLLLGLLVAMIFATVWGFANTSACEGLSCFACGAQPGCSWCPGPDPNTMPGYCEASSLKTVLSCADISPARCTAERDQEARWASCQSLTDNQACLSGPEGSCEWCGGDAEHTCVPPTSLHSPTNASNTSFCDPAGFLFAEKSDTLTDASPACTHDSQGRTVPLHIDRSGDLSTSQAQRTDYILVNGSYLEGLKCAWVIECPFNTSVEMHFQSVNIGSTDAIQIFDGWDTSMVSQLAYFQDFSGDRSGELQGMDTTSISGGPSARLLYSSTPLLTLQFSTGSSDARRRYSSEHGNIRFPAQAQYNGFSLTTRCMRAPAAFQTGYLLLGIWFLLAITATFRCYWQVNFGAKSGGLWKMNVQELLSIAKAMQLNADIDGDGVLEKSELVAAITQSPEWPSQSANGLALSTFEKLSTDDDPTEWINVSWYSLVFILDIFSCIACSVEAFTDLLFIVLQFSRPNGGGVTTGSFSLGITIMSTLVHLSPPGRGVFNWDADHAWSLQQTQQWVHKHARTPDGQRLRSQADWRSWLNSPAGKNRPFEVTPIPEIDFRRRPRAKTCVSSLPKFCCNTFSWCIAAEDGDNAANVASVWISWEDFLGVELDAKNPESNTQISGGEDNPLQEDEVDVLDEFNLRPAKQRQGARVTRITQQAADGFKMVGKAATKVGKGVLGVTTTTKIVKKIMAKEKALSEAGEPGWLCGAPPQNAWDSDAEQILYGRISTPLMYLLTVLQLRVPVEGIIAWRNVRTLKARVVQHGAAACGSSERKACKNGCDPKLRSISVRGVELQRARADLEKALLREGIFEALPQAVLEFQNLWADEFAVLDIMSVPGLPFITSISEYQLTFLIMCITMCTATIDISTPFSAASPLIKVALLASVLMQLISRLLIFGSVLSMERVGQKSTGGVVAILGVFIGTYLITILIHLLCVKLKLYHRGDAAFRKRTETSHYQVSIKTAAEQGSGTTAIVHVAVRGELGIQQLELGAAAHSRNLDHAYIFEPGSIRQFTFECEELGSLDSIVIGHDNSGSSPDWKCESVSVVHLVTQKKWTFGVASWISSTTGLQREVSAQNDGQKLDEDGFGTLFNISSNAGRVERLFLFGFINCFAVTDKNLTLAPTSRGPLVLAFWRIIEASLINMLLVPRFGPASDTDGDGYLDTPSVFQVKSYTAVFVALSAFALLLAAVAAETILGAESTKHKVARSEAKANAEQGGADNPTGLDSRKGRRRITQKLQTVKSTAAGTNIGFLYLMLIQTILVVVSTGSLLFYVYLRGHEDSRRCRSVVLTALLSLATVVLILVRQAGHIRLFWHKYSTARTESATALALLVVFVALAWLLGLRSGADAANDLGSNPLKILTAQCHSPQEWREELTAFGT